MTSVALCDVIRFVVAVRYLLASCAADILDSSTQPAWGPVGVPGAGGTQCPRACFCNSPSRIVYCSRKGLAAIPADLPTTTVQLNMNANTFLSPSLSRRNFSTLTDLEHLYMSECGIERLAVDTFADLSALQWLDLSNNRIKVRSH